MVDPGAEQLGVKDLVVESYLERLVGEQEDEEPAAWCEMMGIEVNVNDDGGKILRGRLEPEREMVA